MLRWTVIFLIVAIIAGIFGFGGIAAGAAGIVGDFDLPTKGAEARAHVEMQRRRMVERAGMHPEPADRPRPR